MLDLFNLIFLAEPPVTFGNLHGSGHIAECAQQRSGIGSSARAPARDGAPQARC
jgi:hypothetical protein